MTHPTSRASSQGSGPVVNRLDALMSRLDGATEHEFALLAIACADQAGLSVGDLAALAEMLADGGWSPADRKAIRDQAKPVLPLKAVLP